MPRRTRNTRAAHPHDTLHAAKSHPGHRTATWVTNFVMQQTEGTEPEETERGCDSSPLENTDHTNFSGTWAIFASPEPRAVTAPSSFSWEIDR